MNENGLLLLEGVVIFPPFFLTFQLISNMRNPLTLCLLMIASILSAQAVEIQLPVFHRDNVQIQGADKTSPERPISIIDAVPLVQFEFEDIWCDSTGDIHPRSTILHIENQYGVSEEDLGEWTEIYCKTITCILGDYKVKLWTSVDYDPEKCAPLWWAYVLEEPSGKEHTEVHAFNMILFQGSRRYMNSIPRPVEYDLIWQRCQY